MSMTKYVTIAAIMLLAITAFSFVGNTFSFDQPYNGVIDSNEVPTTAFDQPYNGIVEDVEVPTSSFDQPYNGVIESSDVTTGVVLFDQPYNG